MYSVSVIFCTILTVIVGFSSGPRAEEPGAPVPAVREPTVRGPITPPTFSPQKSTQDPTVRTPLTPPTFAAPKSERDKASRKLPIFSAAETQLLRAEIERQKSSVEGRDIRLAKQLEYLTKLAELLKLSEELRKLNDNSPSDFRSLLLPSLPNLKIASAKYGDLRHGHTCDATAFIVDKCKLRPASGMIDDQNCLIQSITEKDICGTDPSPQGKKHIRVEWTCGGRWQTAVRIPPSGPLRLICHQHRMEEPEATDATSPKAKPPKA
jgi:hypothetical protein